MAEENRYTRCEACGNDVPGYDTVHLSYDKGSRLLCLRCFNDMISESHGIDFTHESFDPITLQDVDGINHEFHFRVHLLGTKVSIDAFELKNGEPAGYEFQVVGDAEEDLLNLFKKLFERLRRAMVQKHLKEDDRFGPQITDEATVRGHIEWDEDTDGMLPCLVIDGKEISWEAFGRMLMTFEGFHFQLEIFDKSEERQEVVRKGVKNADGSRDSTDSGTT